MSFGTLKADTLTHSTAGSLATNYVVQGSAKAWINLDGTGTVATRDSHNVSSLTDNATGDYTSAFTTSMANDDYAVSGVGAGSIHAAFYNEANTTTSSFRSLFRASGTDTDSDPASVTIHGDLA